MRRFAHLLVPAALLIGTVPAAAVDYTKIDRTLAKEPAYQTKAPKYFLLVFGPEAKTRVWLVLDGDVLYVDRNGNGDLTEEGERVKSGTDGYPLGESTEGDGKTKHTRVVLNVSRSAQQTTYLYALHADVNGKYRQYVTGGTFASRPQDAPIAHLNGPLTMGLHDNDFLNGLAQGKRNLFLSAWIGTPNPSKDTKRTMIDFTAYGPDIPGVPVGIHPVAEIEFPNKDPNGKPIKVQVVLTRRH